MQVITKTKAGRFSLITLAALVFAMAFCVPASAAAKQRTPLDSYIPYKVYSVDQLIAEIKGNPTILKHYAKTFHVPASKVVRYIRNNVVESYVQETGAYTVYCVTKNGYIYPTVQHFKLGTKVFALRNGQPVMKWLCGNPMMSFLPAVHEVLRKVPVVHTITKVSPSIQTIVPSQPTVEIVPAEAPVFQPRVPILAAPNAVTQLINTVTHHANLTPLLPIALLPTLGLHGNGGGSPAPSPTPTPTVGPTPTPTPTAGPTPTPTVGPSPTPSPGISPTPTPTPGGSPTPTPGVSPTPTPNGSPTPTPNGSPTPTPTPTGSPTPTPTGTPIITPTPTPITSVPEPSSSTGLLIGMVILGVGALGMSLKNKTPKSDS